MNILTEIQTLMHNHNKSENDVVYVGTLDQSYKITWEEFKKISDIHYTETDFVASDIVIVGTNWYIRRNDTYYSYWEFIDIPAGYVLSNIPYKSDSKPFTYIVDKTFFSTGFTLSESDKLKYLSEFHENYIINMEIMLSPMNKVNIADTKLHSCEDESSIIAFWYKNCDYIYDQKITVNDIITFLNENTYLINNINNFREKVKNVDTKKMSVLKVHNSSYYTPLMKYIIEKCYQN